MLPHKSLICIQLKEEAPRSGGGKTYRMMGGRTERKEVRKREERKGGGKR